MKLRYSSIFVLFLCIVFMNCCTKDANSLSGDPEGTISLNMMNEDNGMTKLGNSDVYIDKTNNFYSKSSSWLSSLGASNGLQHLADKILIGETNSAAVEIGKGYQVFDRNTLKKFPSGKSALRVQTNYYNLYVDSPIKNENGLPIGAYVKFLQMDVPDNGLPHYGTLVGTIDHNKASTWEISLPFPTSDFEYMVENSDVSNIFEIEKRNNNLIIKLMQSDYKGRPEEYTFYIRIKDSFTFIKISYI